MSDETSYDTDTSSDGEYQGDEGSVGSMGEGAEEEAGGDQSLLGMNCYRNRFAGVYQSERGIVARFNRDLIFIHEGECHYAGKSPELDGVCEPGDEAYCGQGSSADGDSSGSGDDTSSYADNTGWGDDTSGGDQESYSSEDQSEEG